LNELEANLLDLEKLTVVDRKEIDLIRKEFNFQLSGEVADDSMQELGRMLGAQSIVSGSLLDIGGIYRIVVRVLDVQSATVTTQYRADIINDNRVQALLETGKIGNEAVSSEKSSPAKSVKTTKKAIPLRWTVYEYTNEWGDKLGKFFVQYDGTVTSDFRNSATREDIPIREICFSNHQGLSFRTSSATGMGPLTKSESDFVIIGKDGTENKFKGMWGSPSKPYVVVLYSDDLLNALLQTEITIRVSCRSYQFQFNFPDQFPEAYNKLKESE
jgi:hypothetical protein